MLSDNEREDLEQRVKSLEAEAEECSREWGSGSYTVQRCRKCWDSDPANPERGFCKKCYELIDFEKLYAVGERAGLLKYDVDRELEKKYPERSYQVCNGCGWAITEGESHDDCRRRYYEEKMEKIERERREAQDKLDADREEQQDEFNRLLDDT